MQNFKVRRAPWKDTEVNSVRSRQGKGRGLPEDSLLASLFTVLASLSQKEKRLKSLENILKLIAN